MQLVGIEICNFRSIGNERVYLKPWRRCNIIIGQNNSGKSNVIRAVQKIFSILKTESLSNRKPEAIKLEELDLHNRSGNTPFQFSLYFECEKHDELAKIAGSHHFSFDFSWGVGQQSPTIIDFSLSHHNEVLNQSNFRSLNALLEYFRIGWQWTRTVSKDDYHKRLLNESQRFLNKEFVQVIPTVYTIPEFRQIRKGDSYSYDGADLMGLLESYQHPEDGKGEDRAKFDQIEEFVQQLLHLPQAKLEVTPTSKSILLSNNGLRLPLQSYGTGVHQLVIMLTAILSMENSLCCIEEPEIHLHPRLQRELVEFMIKQTSNQYLLSTHSSTFINTNIYMSSEIRDEMQVFYLRNTQGITSGGSVLENEQILDALNDLGVRASDLLQANCVIWVEGPSDRIYLNHWLKLLKPDLIEGLHYSIMFYGGGLRYHLSFSRHGEKENISKPPQDLIDVLKINQRAIVVMDSDRKKRGAHINETKRRIREECETSGGIAWITHGREIENYLSPKAVIDACEKLIGKRISFSLDEYEKFDEALEKALYLVGEKKLKYSTDKANYARHFASSFEITDMSLDLKKQVEALVEKIEIWNI